jgi:hypothetical protein
MLVKIMDQFRVPPYCAPATSQRNGPCLGLAERRSPVPINRVAGRAHRVDLQLHSVPKPQLKATEIINGNFVHDKRFMGEHAFQLKVSVGFEVPLGFSYSLLGVHPVFRNRVSQD